ncbi:virulence factor BrkB family protein [Alkalimonas cellulosilytica]|uniref:virulence factor BrkB family protein n=1 Tax=Alkalimonas cellulosilytica TaxID=3058395 RepID=UPI002E7AF668|nr:virulence factor BrkB family protein [Alkalimonas sp. MEB108]
MQAIKWREFINASSQFVKGYIGRCQHDQINLVGGYLAYISLLSLVPFIAVMFSMLSAFPMFAEFRQSMEGLLYANVVPSRGDEIKDYLNEFIGNTRGMTAIGISALIVVALLLIHNIDKTLNKIWRINKRPRPVISFSIYWMILTLGPILFGTSIAVSSYLVTLTRFAEDFTPGLSSFLLGLVPYLMSLLAFCILYLVVPNTKVRIRHAFWGGLLAMLLFELLKYGFALYITHFPSYQVIYGAMALVPILFLWVYLCWLVVLVGAELTAYLKDWEQLRTDKVSESEECCE